MPSLFPALSWAETLKRLVEIDYKISIGIDPLAERDRTRAAPAARLDTFSAVVALFDRAYLERQKDGRQILRDDYIRDTRRYFGRAAAVWGDRDMTSIGRREGVEFLESIAETHGTTANRTLAALTRLFAWAKEREMVAASPVAGMQRLGTETRRDRVLEPHEIRLVWQAATAMP
jgi:Phage integrase, N-terminal SAM-like domain